MNKDKLTRLDQALKDQQKQREEFQAILTKAVEPVYKIDLRIEQQMKVLEKLEAEKQKALENVRDKFELCITNSHTLPNGYRIQFHGKRPIKITDIHAFMKWLKNNIPATEVATFIGAALSKKELQKFLEQWCDDQKLKGVIKPEIDGIDLGEINFRRLRTSLTKQERK